MASTTSTRVLKILARLRDEQPTLQDAEDLPPPPTHPTPSAAAREARAAAGGQDATPGPAPALEGLAKPPKKPKPRLTPGSLA